jgi:hypothetical protein
MADAESITSASSQYDLWTINAKNIEGKIVSIIGYAGVANTVKVNNTVTT